MIRALCLLVAMHAAARGASAPAAEGLPGGASLSVAAFLAACVPHDGAAPRWPWIVPAERNGLTAACRAQVGALEDSGHGDELHRALDQACARQAAACNVAEAIRRERLAPLYVFGGELGAAVFVVIAVAAKRRRQRRPA